MEVKPHYPKNHGTILCTFKSEIKHQMLDQQPTGLNNLSLAVQC
jgi:hypothetical protein